jgi:hypothetical protein
MILVLGPMAINTVKAENKRTGKKQIGWVDLAA